jgi:hypothetical protein
MSSKLFMLAAALAISATATSAAQAAADYNAYEVCAVYGVTVDPRFCADYVDPAALWVDPLVTGGTEESDVFPRALVEAPANASGHADGLRVEGLRP